MDYSQLTDPAQHKLLIVTDAAVTTGMETSMAGANSVNVDVLVLGSSGTGNLTVTLQQSNDGVNWEDLDDGATVALTVTQGIQHTSKEFRQFSGRFFRLHYSAASGTKWAIAVSVNLADTGAS